jgi:hypothetical protein
MVVLWDNYWHSKSMEGSDFAAFLDADGMSEITSQVAPSVSPLLSLVELREKIHLFSLAVLVPASFRCLCWSF